MRYIVMEDMKGQDAGSYIWPASEPISYTMTDLGTLDGMKSLARDINDAGQVVGTSYSREGNHRAFFWSKEYGMRDLGTPGGRNTVAFRISNAGMVVGWAEDAQGRERAFALGIGT